jgi:hypothetical protein
MTRYTTTLPPNRFQAFTTKVHAITELVYLILSLCARWITSQHDRCHLVTVGF